MMQDIESRLWDAIVIGTGLGGGICSRALAEARVNGTTTTGWGAQGGPGVTSVFYAAALERPEPHDIDHTADMPHLTGGWPVGSVAFAPWFTKAETIIALNGTPDPLSQAAPGQRPVQVEPRPLAGRAMAQAPQPWPRRADLLLR